MNTTCKITDIIIFQTETNIQVYSSQISKFYDFDNMKAAENNKFHNFFISKTRIKDTS